MASMRAFRSLASPAVLQGKRYGREFSGDAGEGGPNGPERNAEGHRDRLDPVPRPSETSLPRGKVLLAGPKQQEMIVVPRSKCLEAGADLVRHFLDPRDRGAVLGLGHREKLRRIGQHRLADRARWHAASPQPPKSSPTALATTAFDKMTGMSSTARVSRCRSVKPMQSST